MANSKTDGSYDHGALRGRDGLALIERDNGFCFPPAVQDCHFPTDEAGSPDCEWLQEEDALQRHR